jgi:alkanesulfonate monooxygenase SsuD/methylene tetrahydromethanopterin reductase-like flavin-dependent oxidoreductase (luciferase family)
LAGHVDANIAATYPDKVREVVSYLEGRGPVFGGSNISSVPEVWVLGAGGSSAPLAAQLGTSFALSLFHPGAAADAAIIRDHYREQFCASPLRQLGPRACIAVAGVCADTEAGAQRIALAHTNSFVRHNIIGTPERWRDELDALWRRFAVDEVVVLELSRDPDDHRAAIEALAGVFALDALTTA